MNDYRKEFIANMKYYRKQKGITQERLAELCDVATSTIGCIESAQQYPSFELLIKIAENLEINPADLFLKDVSNIKSLNVIHELNSIPYESRSSIELMISDLSAKYSTKYSSKHSIT